MILPLEHLKTVATFTLRQHYAETGALPDFAAGEYTLGQWENGQHFLRIDLPDGQWFELAFGDEADAILSAALTTRH